MPHSASGAQMVATALDPDAVCVGIRLQGLHLDMLSLFFELRTGLDPVGWQPLAAAGAAAAVAAALRAVAGGELQHRTLPIGRLRWIWSACAELQELAAADPAAAAPLLQKGATPQALGAACCS